MKEVANFQTYVLEKNGVSVEAFAEELSNAFQSVLEELKTKFPSPDKAPGHKERKLMFSKALSEMGDAFVLSGAKFGLSKDELRRRWLKISPELQKLLVVSGKIQSLPGSATASQCMLTNEYYCRRPH